MLDTTKTKERFEEIMGDIQENDLGSTAVFSAQTALLWEVIESELLLAHQAGRDEMKKECLAAVPEQKHTLEEVSELNKNLPSTLQEQSYSESKGWIACREQTINNINAINTSIKEIESK